MAKLTQEKREQLESLMEHPGFPVLMAELHALAQLRVADLLKYDLDTGSDRELAHTKAKADGAQGLVKALETRLISLKGRQ